MKILGCTSALLNPSPPPPRQLTASVVLETIAAALNSDGAIVEPGDIDSSGMLITTCDGFRFRLELGEPELMDDADWQAVRERAFEAWVRRDSARHARTAAGQPASADTSWMGDSAEIEF